MITQVGKGPWRTGDPPSVGWWPASLAYDRDPSELRWLDGRRWSLDAYPEDTAEIAAQVAAVKEHPQRQPYVMWRERASWWYESND